MNHHKQIVMLSTAGRGGIRAVVDAYERDGIYARWNVRPVYSHVEGSMLRRLAAAALGLLQFLALLLRGKVALLHSHVAMRGSFWRKALFSELARMFHVPVVLHLHGSGMEVFYEAQGNWGKRQIRKQLEKADRVIVLSQSWYDFVHKAAPLARIAIVLNYVLPPVSPRAPREPDDTTVRVLFLGLLGKRKGIYDLLPAFKKALGKCPQLRLFVGGNGEVAETEAAIRSNGLETAVQMLGWVSGEAKIDQLRMADIFVLPSYNEGLPISLLEAMSHEVPVVSTRVGGIPELVRDSVDGYLINAGDQNTLAQRLVELGQSAALRLRMGREGRERVLDKFSDVAVLPQLERIYQEALSGDGAGAART